MTTNLKELNKNLDRISAKGVQIDKFGDMWKTLQIQDLGVKKN